MFYRNRQLLFSASEQKKLNILEERDMNSELWWMPEAGAIEQTPQEKSRLADIRFWC